MTKNGVLCEINNKKVFLDPKNTDSSGVNFVSHAHTDHLPSKNGGTILASLETNEIANLRGFKMQNHVEKMDDYFLITF
jgi:putative mRNA 3-end processing factor